MLDGLRDKRHERRTLLTIIAALIIATSVVMGIFYINLFQSAAGDLTRILPDRTQAWLAAPAPWPRLARIVALDRWAEPESVRALVERDTLGEEGTAGRDVAGIPVPLLREMARAMDGFEVAVIPARANEGASVVVFVEISDPIRRKRILSRLAERTTAVDRHIGYRIDALRESVWHRWAGAKPGPPRVVFMDPWIVFAWGPNRSLEDLLDARVEGRGDAIRRRRGFIDAGTDSELHGAIDVGTLWRIVTRPDAPSRADPMATDGLLEILELLTFSTRLVDTGDRLDLLVDLRDRALATALADGFRSAPHELLPLGPDDATFAVSMTGTSPASMALAAMAFGTRALRDAPRLLGNLDALAGAGTPSTDRPMLLGQLASRALDRVYAAPSHLLERQPFEAALFNLPSTGGAGQDEWLLLLRTDEPEALEGELAATMMSFLGTDLAMGEMATPDGSLFALTDPDGRPILVWQRRLGLVEVAPSMAVLERFDAARANGQTLGRRYDLAAAESAMDRERAVTLFWPNHRLRASPNPFLRIVASALSNDFPWIVTFDTPAQRLQMQSNVGPWTAIAALATAQPRDLDTLFLPGLEPACRARHQAMCTAWPASPACQPFELGRFPRIQSACDRLDKPPTP